VRKGTLPQPGGHVHDILQHTEELLKPRLRGVLHQAAFSVSLASGAVLVALAGGAMEHVATAVYAGAVALLFGTSAAYHRGTWSARARNRMERLDHSMIFVLIAGTYTPFTLLLLDGAFRWVMLGVVWGGALAGIAVRNIRWEAPRWLNVTFYLALGWVAVGILPQVLHRGGVAVLVLLGAGGLFYTLGAVVYARQHPDPSPRWFGFHEIFHTLTLMAFVTHYIAVGLVVFRT
jgi:hemolysin III